MRSLSKAVIRKEQSKKHLLSKPNVVGVGVGEKVSDGERTGDVGIVVSVTRKLSPLMLHHEDTVPPSIFGVPTDVVETGPIHALGYTDYCRPAIPGYSIGHYAVTAGTFGCVVRVDGERFILSNSHVIANSGEAEIGEAVIQPGIYDGGSEKIAELAEFAPISFVEGNCEIANTVAKIFNILASDSKHYLVVRQDVTNKIDAAIAKPISDDIIVDDIVEIGAPEGTALGCLGMEVQKSGRTTGYQRGEITQINATITVGYGEGKTAIFDNQLVISPGEFSAGGDSGSAILDMSNNVVGLLFAGSDNITIANQIDDVLDYFGAVISV